jgi:DNA excision repair protein ERCC-4
MVVHPGSNTVLIMTSSTTTSTHISEFLSTLDVDAEQGAQGRTMMEKKLRLYLEWKGKLSRLKEEGQGAVVWPDKNGETFQKEQGGDGISEALKRKDQVMKEKGACRRRVRGGAPTVGSAGGGDGRNSRKGQKGIIIGEGEMREEADQVANL